MSLRIFSLLAALALAPALTPSVVLAEDAPVVIDAQYRKTLGEFLELMGAEAVGEQIAFYKSPICEKTRMALPTIGQAGAVAIQWARLERIPDFQIRVDERLQKAGLIVSQ